MAPHKPNTIGFLDYPSKSATLSGSKKVRARDKAISFDEKTLIYKAYGHLIEDRLWLMEHLIPRIGLRHLPLMQAFVRKKAVFRKPTTSNSLQKNSTILSAEEFGSIPNGLLSPDVICLQDVESGTRFFPAFQWNNGKFREGVGSVVRRLREPPLLLNDWQILMWFASANGWLSGKTPMESLENYEAVVRAAEQEQLRMED